MQGKMVGQDVCGLLELCPTRGLMPTQLSPGAAMAMDLCEAFDFQKTPRSEDCSVEMPAANFICFISPRCSLTVLFQDVSFLPSVPW